MTAALLTAAQGRLPQMLADLERLISIETPSSDHQAVAQGAAAVAEVITERLGQPPEVLARDGVTHLRLRIGAANAADVHVVLLTHQDTVWPHGTLHRLPFSTDNGVLRGPGCFDMLTGLVMAIHAVALLRECGAPTAGISVLVTGDEEVGSATSRALIMEEVTSSASPPAVLVLEASADEGRVKVARKGASSYRVTVTGRAAHAGLEPEKGINAGLELAQHMVQIAALGDPALGTSVIPTSLAGGTTSNTVPASAYVDVDSRAWTRAEQERVDTALRSLTPQQDGASVEVTGGINRPPLQREHSMQLYAQLEAACLELGMSTPEAADVGGASDGNITAGAGAPTLDGLGAVGGGAHADNEHVTIDEIPARTAMVAALTRRLLADAERA